MKHLDDGKIIPLNAGTTQCTCTDSFIPQFSGLEQPRQMSFYCRPFARHDAVDTRVAHGATFLGHRDRGSAEGYGGAAGLGLDDDLGCDGAAATSAGTAAAAST
jgi:hypothetical protein